MNFGKRVLTVLVLALVIILPAQAFAEVGIQLIIPNQVTTGDANLAGGASGQGVLLSFGLDSGTTVGILSEQINFTDNQLPSTYNVNALRLSKDVVGDAFFVAMDLGNAQNAVRQSNLADIVFGGKLTGKKDKITSFFNVEVMYRVLNPGASFVAGGTAKNYGGVFVNLGAGLTF